MEPEKNMALVGFGKCWCLWTTLYSNSGVFFYCVLNVIQHRSFNLYVPALCCCKEYL